MGVIANGTPAPEACLRHCLNGCSALASSHGCSMLRWLVKRSENPNAEPVEIPDRCPRGYGVSLQESHESGDPDVLILRPPEAGQGDEANLPAAALGSFALQNRRLDQEVSGLADELLRSYEQINLIFDMSAQVAVLTDTDEVRRMLLGKLRHLFDADTVYYVAPACRRVQRIGRDGRIHQGWMVAAKSDSRTSGNGDGGAKGLSHQRETGSSHPQPISKPGEAPAIHGPAVLTSGPPGDSESIDLPPEFAGVLEALQQSQRVIVSSEDIEQRRTGYGTSMWGPLREEEGAFSVVGVIRRQMPFVSGDMLLLDSALTYGGHILSNLRLVDQLKRTSFEAVRALVNAIDQKDSYTCGHSERVGFLARVTGQFMGLPARQLQELEWAGLLHDVGKIGIPERVLNKPGKLTSEEMALIREHPARSFEVLRPVQSLEPVLEAVLYHHENPDGSGYPEGLKGDEIPLAARIIHVVDVFDALTSSRSYRHAFNVAEAIEMIKRDAGDKLDAHIVEQFLAAWAILPRTHPEQYKRWFEPATLDSPRRARSADRSAAAAEGGYGVSRARELQP